MSERYAAKDLEHLAAGMLEAAGLAGRLARSTARIFVEADLLGYTTHGIQFLPQYCSALEKGTMTREGDMTLLRDDGASLVYDAGMLPGPACVSQAVAEALGRCEEHGVVTALVRRSQVTACLAAYLVPVIEAGRIGLIFVSSPSGAAVAPPGGARARYSTNPMAAAFPTGGDAVLIDMATSATTNRLTERMVRDGKTYTGEPMLDADGSPTNDPGALAAGGAIRPIGGESNEHKGFALALMIEALSAALSGGGRALQGETGERAGSATFIQIIDPERFAGRDVFLREMDALTAQLLDTPVRPGSHGVRIPGQRAMAARRDHLQNGVILHPSIRPHVEPVAKGYGLRFPDPV